MKSFIKNYRSSLILLTAIIIGGIAGVVFGEKTSVIQPLGDLFLNLMFTIIVPLVFFSIASAIANMSGMKRLGKIMGSIVVVFLTTAALAAVIGFIGTTIINPLEGTDTTAIKELMENSSSEEHIEKVSFFSQLVNTVTVSDFPELLSRSNMLQLIVFSVLIGLSTALVGEKARPITEFLTAGTAVMMKVVKIVMYYAPIGLGAYFAAIIGQLGPQILEGYARTFILYLVLALIYYFGFFTLYAFIAGGKDGVNLFWKNALAPSITAIATCSSARPFQSIWNRSRKWACQRI